MSNKLKLDTSKTLRELAEEGWTTEALVNALCDNMGVKRKNKHLVELVAEIIHEIGIPAHLRGYFYLRRAIELTVRDQTLIKNVGKKLYPMIAKEYGSTAGRVNRDMLNAIEVAWEQSDSKNLQKYFGDMMSTNNYRPTSLRFIATVSERIYMNGGWND